MSIQLISVSHKTADLNIRSCFALTKEQQIKYLKDMVSGGYIEECALLSTCNRLEIYLYGKDGNQREIFSEAEKGLLRMIAFPEGVDGAEYLRFYEGEKAERHLFCGGRIGFDGHGRRSDFRTGERVLAAGDGSGNNRNLLKYLFSLCGDRS